MKAMDPPGGAVKQAILMRPGRQWIRIGADLLHLRIGGVDGVDRALL